MCVPALLRPFPRDRFPSFSGTKRKSKSIPVLSGASRHSCSRRWVEWSVIDMASAVRDADALNLFISCGLEEKTAQNAVANVKVTANLTAVIQEVHKEHN